MRLNTSMLIYTFQFFSTQYTYITLQNGNCQYHYHDNSMVSKVITASFVITQQYLRQDSRIYQNNTEKQEDGLETIIYYYVLILCGFWKNQTHNLPPLCHWDPRVVKHIEFKHCQIITKFLIIFRLFNTKLLDYILLGKDKQWMN